jgi:hypothetical protein
MLHIFSCLIIFFSFFAEICCFAAEDSSSLPPKFMYIYIFVLRKKSFVSVVITFVYVLAEIRTSFPTDFNTQKALVKLKHRQWKVLNEKILENIGDWKHFYSPQKIAPRKSGSVIILRSNQNQ